MEGLRFTGRNCNFTGVLIRLDPYFSFFLHPNPLIEFSCWKVWYRLDGLDENVYDGLLLDSRAACQLTVGMSYKVAVTAAFHVKVPVNCSCTIMIRDLENCIAQFMLLTVG